MDTPARRNDVLVLVDTCRKPILASMQDHYLVQARITCTVAAGRLDLQVYIRCGRNYCCQFDTYRLYASLQTIVPDPVYSAVTLAQRYVVRS